MSGLKKITPQKKKLNSDIEQDVFANNMIREQEQRAAKSKKEHTPSDSLTQSDAVLLTNWNGRPKTSQLLVAKEWVRQIVKGNFPEKKEFVQSIQKKMNDAGIYGGKWDKNIWISPPQKAYQGVSNLYDRYLFGDLDGVQMVDYQRDDASYGGLGTNRDFIWNPRLDDYGRSKAFGYDGHTTSSIDYMLLSVAFVVFMAICCCLVVAVSFVSGYITKSWFSKKKKTQSDYDSISVSNV